MSKLQLFGRPYVVFDPHNKDHRRWFADFNKNLSWGHCPVRFVVDSDQGDLLTMIQRSLIQYYVDKEFQERKPLPVVQKKKAEVKHIRKVVRK
jgi:hypothetical protein